MRALASIAAILTAASAIGSGCATTKVNTPEKSAPLDEPADDQYYQQEAAPTYSASNLTPPDSELIGSEIKRLSEIATKCGTVTYYGPPMEVSHSIITPSQIDGRETLKFEYYEKSMLGPELYCISVISNHQERRETSALVGGTCVRHAEYYEIPPESEIKTLLRIKGPHKEREFLTYISLIRNNLPEVCK